MHVSNWFRLLRPEQWIKNAIVAAPLLFTPLLLTRANCVFVALGVLDFCFLSSAVYILNDYVDRESDRSHPDKAKRPLAAGTIGLPVAAATALLLLAAAGALASCFALPFAMVVGAYLANNVLYSVWLKHVAIVDVMSIAVGFVLRIEAGAAIIHADTSGWIVIVTGMLALFVALAKRRDDLVRVAPSDHRRSLEGYNKSFVDAAMNLILASILAVYVVYTMDASVQARLGTDKLYLSAPFVAAGMLRYLQLTLVEERSGAPATLLFSDWILCLTIVGWALSVVVILHF